MGGAKATLPFGLLAILTEVTEFLYKIVLLNPRHDTPFPSKVDFGYTFKERCHDNKS